jgi:YD repeat-containing protein
MKNKIYSLLLIIFFITISQGQTNTDLRPAVKSPEVNKFEQYMNMPVNLVSGTPQVNIPIYTLEYGGMTLPISLEYDASGVKVESIASSVGQNWSLNVGGVVSRIVKGAPDDGDYVVSGLNYDLNIKGFYRDKGLTNLDNALGNGSTYGNFIGWLQECAKGKQDAQPDLFYFSTPQGGAKFVFNKNREVVYLENTDFIIKEDFMTNFRSWSATAPNGINYKFGLTTATSNLDNIVEQNFTNQGKNDAVNHTNFSTNTWFLTEISSPITNNKITLNYISNDYSNTILNKPTKTDICFSNITSDPGPFCDDKTKYYNLALHPYGGPSDFSTSTPYTMLSHTKSKVINTITAGTITIYFDYSDRFDLSLNFENHAAKRLDKIRILENGNCIKFFDFTYSYSLCDSTKPSGLLTAEDSDSKRLILDKVTESSCDGSTLKPYSFIYNAGQMPYKLSFAQDKFGFYNGATNNQSLFARYDATDLQNLTNNRNSNFFLAMRGSLQKIIYPTKGSISFEFEQHLSDVPVGYVKENTYIYLASGVSPINSYNSQSFTINPADGNNLKIKIYLTRGSSGYSSPVAGCPISNYNNAIEIVNNSNPGTVIYRQSYGQLDPLISGHQDQFVMKEIEEFLDTSKFLSGQSYTIKVYGITDCFNVSATVFIPKTIQVPYYEIGGLRIKKTTYKNYDETTSREVSYTYSNAKSVPQPLLVTRATFNFLNETNFYALSNTLDASKIGDFEIIATDFYKKVQRICPLHANSFTRTLISNMITGGNLYSTGSFIHSSLGSSPFDINFMGPQISYGKVEETDGNGKKINYFHDYKSYSELDWNSFINNFTPAPPVFQDILAGEKYKVEIYDKNSSIIKKEIIDHNYTNNDTFIEALAIYSDGNMPLFKMYTIKGQTKTLKTETETTKLNGQDLTTTKDYEYNGVDHNQPTKIKTTNSTGEVIETKMQYPLDLQTEPYANNLISQNRKSNPLVVTTIKNGIQLSEQKTEYGKFNSATSGILLTLPKFVWAKKGEVAANPLEKKVTYNYDTSGNLIEYTPENGTTSTIIWGYNKTLPIAKIENATYSQVASISGFGTGFSIATSLTAAQETALRNGLTSSMITTYTYKPLIGITSITDPKGDMTTYTYDALNRLKWVKDKNGNILSENQYHYKN